MKRRRCAERGSGYRPHMFHRDLWMSFINAVSTKGNDKCSVDIVAKGGMHYVSKSLMNAKKNKR